MLEGSLAVRIYTVGITCGRNTVLPSSNPRDPDFLFALLRASINPFASREPSLPNFFVPIGGESALNQGDPKFSVRVLRLSMGSTNLLTLYLPSSIGLLKPNFRNAITLELHERACWPESYLDYG